MQTKNIYLLWFLSVNALFWGVCIIFFQKKLCKHPKIMHSRAATLSPPFEVSFQ